MLEVVTDETFARYVQQTGMATPAQLEEARKLQAGGGAPSLAEALVKLGVITATQRESVERKLEHKDGISELGGCRLIRKLGEGGMGAVYLAEETAAKRKVALKILPKKHAQDPQFLQRFRREAEAATQFDHPNIVRAFSAGEDRGYHFYVMEYCEGESLKKRIERQSWVPHVQAAGLVAQVAQGLKYAHDRGFIHRDIKPENVIVTPAGVARILDLGLTKNLSDSEATFRTVTGAALGTPHYISPEQARGDKSVDGRADIYSLGATFYHLLTGRTPFSGTSIFEVIQKHLMEQLPDPRDLRPEIPDDVVHVIRRMMAKKPEDRYRDCAEVLNDLERATVSQKLLLPPLDAALSSIALPARAAVPAPAAPPKRKTMRVAGGVAAGALILAVGVAVWPSDKPQPPAPPPIVKRDVKPTPPVVKEEPKPETKPEPKPEPIPETKPEVKPEPPALPKVEPKPEPAPEPPKAVPVPVEPPKPVAPSTALGTGAPPSRVPLPAADKIQEALKDLRAAHKADFDRTGASDRVALARKLLGLDAPADPAANFIRIRVAKDHAVLGGDPTLALEAVDRLAEAFVVEPLPIKADALAACDPKVADAASALVSAALDLIDEAIAADDYVNAAKPMTRAKSKANEDQKAALLAREKSIAFFKAEFDKVSAYKAALAARPGDPAASFYMGQFACLVKDDWDRGLPLLAQGNNAAYRGLAEKELANPKAAAVMDDLCEGWLTLAVNEARGVRKDALTRRARHWYDQAEAQLQEDRRKDFAQKLAALERTAAPKPVASPAPKPAAAPVVAGGADILKRVNAVVLAKAEPKDGWKMNNGALESPASGLNMTPAYLHLPTGLPESCDLTLVAERIQGNEDLVIAVSNGTSEFALVLDGWGGQQCGVHGPNGPFQWQQRAPGRIFQGGRRRTIVIEVRKNAATLKVDGTKVLDIPDYKLSSVPANLQAGRKAGIVTLATVKSVFRFSAIVVSNPKP